MQKTRTSTRRRGSSALNQSAATVSGLERERASARSRVSLPIQKGPAGTYAWRSASRQAEASAGRAGRVMSHKARNSTRRSPETFTPAFFGAAPLQPPFSRIQ